MNTHDFDAMIAPIQYRLAQAEKREAYEKYNYASVKLELASIKERFAEIYSQIDPINKIIEMKLDERDRLCASAYYVIMGRLPKEQNI